MLEQPPFHHLGTLCHLHHHSPTQWFNLFNIVALDLSIQQHCPIHFMSFNSMTILWPCPKKLFLNTRLVDDNHPQTFKSCDTLMIIMEYIIITIFVMDMSKILVIFSTIVSLRILILSSKAHIALQFFYD
jgi:hypothetical protein